MTIAPKFPHDAVPQAPHPIAWKLADSDDNPDFETGILLRSLVLPAFETAQSWRDLAEALDSLGFGLAIHHGRLTLTDCSNGTYLCTGRYLGKPLAEMARRLGKPVIRASVNCSGDGTFRF